LVILKKVAFLVFAFALATATLAIAGSTPSFIQIGKTYQCWLPSLGTGPVVKVLEIGDDGWIKVKDTRGVYWLNIKTLLSMQEQGQ